MFEERYEIIKKLGEGGTGETYLVRDTRLERDCVMKKIFGESEYLHEAVKRETKALLRVRHTGVPALNDIVFGEDCVCLIMEYMRGETLREYIEREGPMQEEIVVETAMELCSIVEFLHSLIPPVIHGDIKPENIIKGERGLALLDFGASICFGNCLDERVIACSKGYSPPEILKGERPDLTWDVYSMGALMFYLSTAENPGGVRGIYPIREWDPLYSERLELTILQCCREDPAQRIRNIAELKASLQKRRRRNPRDAAVLFRPLKSIILTEGKI